jgi:hypothetical protein
MQFIFPMLVLNLAAIVLSNIVMQDGSLKASFTALNGLEGEVNFEHNGTAHTYKVQAVSLYAESATATAHTRQGLVHLDTSRSRFFKSVERGRRARAQLHEDGSVSGLFEAFNQIIRVGVKEAPQVALRVRHGENLTQIKEELRGNGSEPFNVAVDDDEHMPHFLNGDKAYNAEHGIPTQHQPWNGTTFYPGCYPGDSVGTQDMVIELVADTKAYKELGTNLQATIETAVSEASFIYESQMRIQLVIGNLKIYQTRTGLTGYESDLNSEDCGDANPSTWMPGKLTNLRDVKRYGGGDRYAASHLFTGCGDGTGLIGYAYTGAVCNSGGWNVGVNQVNTAGLFLLFAHELGHNLGMNHPFDVDGDYPTKDHLGGIMDYGNGTLNGYYQFNEKFRKVEACSVLNNFWGDSCGNNFPGPPTAAANVNPPSSANAAGDPHLTNLKGEKFDVNVEGDHILLQMPRGARGPDLNLEVVGTVKQLKQSNDPCNQFFFTKFVVRGNWVGSSKEEVVIDSGRWGIIRGFGAIHHENGQSKFTSFGMLSKNQKPTKMSRALLWACSDNNAYSMRKVCRRMGRDRVQGGNRNLPNRDLQSKIVMKLAPRASMAPLHLSFSRFESASPAYLNMAAEGLHKELGRVGGLMGTDSHSEVSKPVEACRKSKRNTKLMKGKLRGKAI